MTFDLGWHWKVKSMSFSVHWAGYHRPCIIRQRSCQTERHLANAIEVKSAFQLMMKPVFRDQRIIPESHACSTRKCHHIYRCQMYPYHMPLFIAMFTKCKNLYYILRISFITSSDFGRGKGCFRADKSTFLT